MVFVSILVAGRAGWTRPGIRKQPVMTGWLGDRSARLDACSERSQDVDVGRHRPRGELVRRQPTKSTTCTVPDVFELYVTC